MAVRQVITRSGSDEAKLPRRSWRLRGACQGRALRVGPRWLADDSSPVLICLGAIDHGFEHLVRLAGGAADEPHLFQIVVGLEQVALLGLPHAVIRPGHRVIGIGGERAFVPDLGVVVASELAARIADQFATSALPSWSSGRSAVIARS